MDLLGEDFFLILKFSRHLIPKSWDNFTKRLLDLDFQICCTPVAQNLTKNFWTIGLDTINSHLNESAHILFFVDGTDPD